ncbi:hypothetical protein [Aliiroseovarius sp. PrR006]|uniref:hypothetical protein n=1 Tax=Aliiroseovarius sp. PrR006 TaxID=2706883 RepID=UPI0013D07D6D|nr:hypothetical protein [Aliiroseovarius sp. PrR006]NDW52670.1 hypothetical protein [Aliiroseovarius sp. PrR006]
MQIELISLLMVHFLCNASAQEGPLNMDAALFCSSNFERVKVALHPTLSLEAYDQMTTEERVEISVEGYAYYKAWLQENPDLSEQFRLSATVVMTNW